MSFEGATASAAPRQAGNNLNSPTETLYISNFQSDLQKEDCLRELWALFTQHGHVIDIAYVRNKRRQVVAFVTYTDPPTATQALRARQGQVFDGRPMTINYSRSKSHALSRLDGTAKFMAPVLAPAAGLSSVLGSLRPSNQPPGAAGMSDLQRSVFAPGSAAASAAAAQSAPSPQGTKRARSDSGDAQPDKSMADAEESEAEAEGSEMDMSD